MRKPLILALSAAACVLLAGCSSSNESKKAEEKSSAPPAATAPEAKKAEPTTPPPTPTPEPKKAEPKKTVAGGLPEKAPDVFKINMDTSKGLIVMECHKDWSPKGVEHLYDLVKIHFYDDVRFFRVIAGFMAQFGINGNPSTNAVWANANILDDPMGIRHNTRGMVTFARTGAPNSRSTQLFINYKDNSFLDSTGFTPVCQVTTGMDVVDQLYSGYGEGAPGGAGPEQGRVGAQGNAYLNSQFPRLDYVKKATIVLQ